MTIERHWLCGKTRQQTYYRPNDHDHPQRCRVHTFRLLSKNLSPVHISNSVKATSSNATSRSRTNLSTKSIERCFDIVDVYGNNVERVFWEISFTLFPLCRIIRLVHVHVAVDNVVSTLLPVWTSFILLGLGLGLGLGLSAVTMGGAYDVGGECPAGLQDHAICCSGVDSRLVAAAA